VHGCGWDSGTARERSSALAASVASRYALGADGPGARGSRVTASRYALGAEGGGTARPGAYMCPPRNCARCLLEGSVGMSKTSCAARCSRGSVARRTSRSCRGRGWGGTPRGPCCHRLGHARSERWYGGSWQEGSARSASPPLQGLASRAAGAPTTRVPARRGRRVRVPRAFKRPARTFGGGWCAHQLRITPGWLPLIGGSTFTHSRVTYTILILVL
jgi:hypothetical protein